MLRGFQPRFQPTGFQPVVIEMQLSETPKLGFTGVVNANLLIHGRQKCPKYLLYSDFNRADYCLQRHYSSEQHP